MDRFALYEPPTDLSLTTIYGEAVETTIDKSAGDIDFTEAAELTNDFLRDALYPVGDGLDALRAKMPGVPIEPTPGLAFYFVVVNGAAAETILSVPINAKLFRITTHHLSNAVLLFSTQRGISTTANSASTPNFIITNPPPVWRDCRGVKDLVFRNTGAFSSGVSVEFLF